MTVGSDDEDGETGSTSGAPSNPSTGEEEAESPLSSDGQPSIPSSSEDEDGAQLPSPASETDAEEAPSTTDKSEPDATFDFHKAGYGNTNAGNAAEPPDDATKSGNTQGGGDFAANPATGSSGKETDAASTVKKRDKKENSDSDWHVGDEG